MTGFIELTLLVGKEYMTHLLGSYFFWIVLFFIALQYKKSAKNRQASGGAGGPHFLVSTAVAAFYGTAGGLIGSALMILTGVNLASIGISYLWGLALLLMFLNPRFLCFAYSGGIIALCKILFGRPDVNVPQLMGLIAALHLIESLLIYLNGHTGAIPMVFKKSDGRLVGGFTLQKFWPLPIVAVAVLPFSQTSGFSLLPAMPSWWPLIGNPADHVLSSVGVLIPFIAGLGYGDIALAHTPAEKSRRSAIRLGIYSLILLVLAIVASQYPVMEAIASGFAPLGHELVVYLGQRSELKRQPLYIPSLRGVRILEVFSNSPAKKAGLATGDVLFTVNGMAVNSQRDLETLVLHDEADVMELEFISRIKNIWRRVPVRVQPGEPIGVITVPEGLEQAYTELKQKENVIRWMIRKIARL